MYEHSAQIRRCHIYFISCHFLARLLILPDNPKLKCLNFPWASAIVINFLI